MVSNDEDRTASKIRKHSGSVNEIQRRLKILRLAYARMQGIFLSQADFAKHVGISPQAWRQITSDNRLSVDVAIRICEATGVQLDWIYRGQTAYLPLQLYGCIKEIESQEGIGLD